MFFRLPPPEGSIGRMIKPFELRRVQKGSSEPAMLDYTCGQHALTKSGKYFKNVDFSPKNQRLPSKAFFTFGQTRVDHSHV